MSNNRKVVVVTISEQQWSTLLHIKKDDFDHPEKMQWQTVQNLDRFAQMVGSKPIILDDWRKYNPKNPNSRHYYGDAIDTTWPGQDPLRVNQLALDSKLWSGIGIYYNDRDVTSFHTDNRPTRSPESPAKWGDYITHPYDENAQTHKRVDEYTTMQAIVSILEKKTLPVTLSLIALGLAIYLFNKKGS
ncbi:MAG: hypothetical protein ACYTBJ_06720 [Planctomycetota bacterium]